MTAAPATPRPTNPNSGSAPISDAPDPPAVDTSVRAWPPKDCPRSTVNTPTTADTNATAPPTIIAVCTGWLEKNPGSNTHVNNRCTRFSPPRRSAGSPRSADSPDWVVGQSGGGHDQDAAVDVDHVDVMAVQPAQDVVADDLAGRAAGRPAAGEVDHRVHHWQEWVDLVGGQQHGDLLVAGDPVQQPDDLVAAAEVEVGQRLIEQEQPRVGR